MRNRRFVVGLVLTGLLLGAGALPAKALLGVPTPPVPSPGQLQSTVKSLVPAKPTVIVPTVPDPNHLALPILPYVAIPDGARPALGVLSPTAVVTCQVAYLGPLGGIVALSKVMDTLGQHPVSPSFFSPAFGPVSTICTASAFPTVSSCGPDGTITDALADHPEVPALPGGVPTVDPFATVPAPFASLVVEIGAVQYDIAHYVYNDSAHLPLQKKVYTQLECK
ncbi:MAG: hypothetical protein QOG90_2207 [Actinomycetota bacterium]|jgi:hypothetical protein